MDLTYEEEDELLTSLGIDLDTENQTCTEPELEGLDFSICGRLFPMSQFPDSHESLFHILNWYQWTTSCRLSDHHLAEFASTAMLETFGVDEPEALISVEMTEEQRDALNADDQFLMDLIVNQTALNLDVAFGFIVGQGAVFDHIRSIENVDMSTIPQGLMESITMYLEESIPDFAWREGPSNVQYW